MSAAGPSAFLSIPTPASELEFVPVTAAEQLATVAALARDIWYEFYVPLIGRAQVDYMVGKFQSAAAMQSQIDQGYEYLLVRRPGATAVRLRGSGRYRLSRRSGTTRKGDVLEQV